VWQQPLCPCHIQHPTWCATRFPQNRPSSQGVPKVPRNVPPHPSVRWPLTSLPLPFPGSQVAELGFFMPPQRTSTMNGAVAVVVCEFPARLREFLAVLWSSSTVPPQNKPNTAGADVAAPRSCRPPHSSFPQPLTALACASERTHDAPFPLHGCDRHMAAVDCHYHPPVPIDPSMDWPPPCRLELHSVHFQNSIEHRHDRDRRHRLGTRRDVRRRSSSVAAVFPPRAPAGRVHAAARLVHVQRLAAATQ